MGSNNDETCVSEDFLAHLVHDLKTPVVTIGGFARRILNGKMGATTPEQKEGLKVILRSCDRLEHDLKMALQHMKVDLADRLSPKVFDIVEVANRLCEELRPEADEKKLSLSFQAPTEAVPIEADPFIIEKLIFNLIDNAVRYTDQGGDQGGDVQVELCVQGEFVEIKVADTGKGIEKEKLDLVLQPFEEVMGVQDRELRGFGLGLSNVKRYAELHGGELSVESTPGKGSTFIVRIPRYFDEDTDESGS